MKTIATIEGENIIENDDGSVSYKSKAAIDSDGSGPSHGDPCWQSDTSLHLDGKPLNADVDKYIAVPPAIIQGVNGIVLGCKARVLNTQNGTSTDAVVGDVGPLKKLGEVSIATAAALGLDPSPTHGGTDKHIIRYDIFPGRPAIVAGKHYRLQPASAA